MIFGCLIYGVVQLGQSNIAVPDCSVSQLISLPSCDFELDARILLLLSCESFDIDKVKPGHEKNQGGIKD